MNEAWAWEIVTYSTLLGLLGVVLIGVLCCYIAERIIRRNK